MPAFFRVTIGDVIKHINLDQVATVDESAGPCCSVTLKDGQVCTCEGAQAEQLLLLMSAVTTRALCPRSSPAWGPEDVSGTSELQLMRQIRTRYDSAPAQGADPKAVNARYEQAQGPGGGLTTPTSDAKKSAV